MTGLLYFAYFAVAIGAAVLIGCAHTAAERAIDRHVRRALDDQPFIDIKHCRVVPEPTVPRQLTHANSHRQENR